MTTAKTKTLSPAAASRLAVEDRLLTEATCRDDMQGTQSKVEAIKRAWDRGDDSLTAEDMAKAVGEATRAERLYLAAVNSRKAAERAVINEDTGLANVIGKVLADLLPGVQIELHTTTPPTPETLPVLHVIQTKASTRNTIEGYASGSVEIVGHLPSWTERLHPLDSERLKDALDRANVRTTEHGVRTRVTISGERAEHRTGVEVTFAVEPIPVIAHEPRDSHVSYLAQALIHDVSRPVVQARLRDHALVGVKLVDGTRRTTVRVGMKLTAQERSVESRNIGYALASREIEAVDGRHFMSLGRVESVSVSRTEGGLTATLVLVSRTTA